MHQSMTHLVQSIARASVALVACVALCSCAHRTPRPASTQDAEQIDYEQRLAEAMRSLDRGRDFQERNDLDRAEAEFRHSIELLPDMGAAWNNLGLVYMARDRTLEADSAFRSAADAMPTDPRPLVNLGILLHNKGHATQARTAFLGALRRDPNHVEALRGAYVADLALRTTDEDMLDRVSRALLVERDPVWAEKYRFEKLRLEQALRVRLLQYR